MEYETLTHLEQEFYTVQDNFNDWHWEVYSACPKTSIYYRNIKTALMSVLSGCKAPHTPTLDTEPENRDNLYHICITRQKIARNLAFLLGPEPKK